MTDEKGVERQVSLSSFDFYPTIRRTALAPPDELAIASVRYPSNAEKLNETADTLWASQLKTEYRGRTVLVVSIYNKFPTHDEVWLSLFVPANLEQPSPIATIALFAARFGILLVVAGTPCKFALNASTPVVPGVNTDVVGIAEDGTMPFAVFAPFSNDGSRVFVPIAFGIDLNHYAMWQLAAMPRALDGTFIKVQDEYVRIFQQSALLNADAVLRLDLDLLAGFKEAEYQYFLVQSDGFTLSSGLSDGKFYIQRNEDRAELELPDYQSGDKATMLWAWSKKLIRVEMTTERITPKVLFGEAETKPTYPPRKLLAWARQTLVRPQLLYENEQSLLDTVLRLLEGVYDKIIVSNMQNAFWNESGSKATPKKEVQVHRIVDALLFDGCTAKNLQCLAEPRVDGGNIDFLISGTLITGEAYQVCVEFKNAHARDLQHGATVQLPAYMDSRASDLGIYCILYYSCEKYRKPAQSDDDVRNLVGSWIASLGRNITPIVWDLGLRKPPSKR